jgi:hypothetical protein
VSQLLDRVREAIRTRHYSIRTEESYIRWIREHILFSGKRHPAELGAKEVAAFVSHLAVKRNATSPPPPRIRRSRHYCSSTAKF